jgi:heat shock protein HslJ
MKKLCTVLSLIVISLYISACSSSEGTYYKEYELNGVWILDNLGGASVTSSNFANGAPWMELNIGKTEMAGNSGCNGVGGTVYASSDMILFNNLISTKIFCENVDEGKLFSAYDNTRAWTIENERLFLYDAKGGIVLASFIRGEKPVK